MFSKYGIRSLHNGSVAEWSKALDLGSSLSGGVGSNPTAIIFSFPSKILHTFFVRKIFTDFNRFGKVSLLHKV